LKRRVSAVCSLKAYAMIAPEWRSTL